MQKTFQIKSVDRTHIYPLGVSFEEDGLRISTVCEGMEEAGIILYDTGTVCAFHSRKTAGWGQFVPCFFLAITIRHAAISFTGGKRYIRILTVNGSAILTGTACKNQICPGASPLWKHMTGETTKTCTSPMMRCLFTPCM